MSSKPERFPAPDVGVGWTVMEIIRQSGKSAGHKDKYWFSPGGKRFRSKAEISRFQEALELNNNNEEEAWECMKTTPAKKKKTKEAAVAAANKASAATSRGPSAASSSTNDDSTAVTAKKFAGKRKVSLGKEPPAAKKTKKADEDMDKKPPARGACRATKRKKAIIDDDSWFEDDNEEQYEDAEFDSDEDFEELSYVEEESEEELLSEEEEERPKKKKPKKKANKKKVAAKKKKTINDEGENKADEEEGGDGKKSMAESFRPIDAPPYFRESLQQIQKNHECLDPCGIEATDNIIENIIGDQLDKIGSLLVRALRSKDCDLGSAASPLNIATACSGTDAPVLSLTILKEQMDLRKPLLGLSENDTVENLLHTEHVFSCEIEPFKQAYLARNFSANLYPNISDLCDENPRDAWGRPVPLGDFNLAVMGTSCKNFSTQRTKHRLDIEDKGCSGETFLAAVELLFKKKPKYALFENVEKAPWAKMKEYVTGRIKLSNCSSTKAIKEVSTQEKNSDLTFALEKKKIVADKVPGVFGVRSGSELRAFLKGDSTNLCAVSFPKKKKTCTLKELMKHNNIKKQTDTLVFDTGGGATFCAHFIKVDTKNYGLPQTRNRVYMFVWQPDGDNINDDLGKYWEAIVKHLQAPTRYSLEAFLLQEDHDVIRVFREALRGPAGRVSKRAVFLQPDFWASTSANLKYSVIARERSGIEPLARTLTSWGSHGKKQVPPHYWLEFIDLQQQREIDMLDVLHASAARDAESHDSSFSSHFWNISQNIGKEKHRGAVAGVAGCVTPGGIVFLPHLGRPTLGCEKLLFQGIPYFRLLLGNETEVQLGDLAGNAMSLTVISAMQIGVLAAKQLRAECLEIKPEVVLKKDAALPRKSLEERLNKDIATDLMEESDKLKLPCLSNVFKKLLPLASEAVQSSILCTCESSGRNSDTLEFVQCRVCGVSCCRNCIHSTSGLQLKSHDTQSLSLNSRKGQGIFQSKLQCIVPTSLVFGKEGISSLSSDHRAKDLDKSPFSLHCIRRDKKTWRIVYYARADGGVGEAIAEFTVTVGEIETRGADETDVKVGVEGSLRCFLPAKLPPIVYGDMIPCAKVTMLSEKDRFEWVQRIISNKTVGMMVTGEGDSPSFRMELGINDGAQKSIAATSNSSHKKKAVTAAKARGEERRFFYPKNWKTWPETIVISGAAPAICGKYVRSNCRQTINQSALWIRKADGFEPTLYLLLHPKVSRNGPDYAVISSSISHKDLSSNLATFPSRWQPCDALDPKFHKVEGVELTTWCPLPMECRVPSSNITITSPMDKSSNTLLKISGLSELDAKMLSRNDGVNNTSSGSLLSLNVCRGQAAQQTVRVFNSTCVTAIQQYAAKGLFKYDLSPHAKWIDYVPSGEIMGCNESIVPIRPPAIWSFDNDRQVWARQFGPEASRNYFTAVKNAPRTFSMALDMDASELVIYCEPKIAVHRAARNLIEGRGNSKALGKSLAVQYRFVDSARQKDPILDPFHVSNCESLDPTNIGLKSPHELYDRQKRVITKMAQIEDEGTSFEELEMFEDSMPGSTGWSLIAKASRNRKIRGGVIADAIGAGKTVISISLILRGIQTARAGRKAPSQTSATLVVVPPGLIDQWRREIDKFAPSLNVVCVYDHKGLMAISVKDLLQADVIACPVDILESKGYFSHLLEISGDSTTDAPKMPTHSGQDENHQAKGVWVAASSRDPYLGKYGKGDQKSRNESAYYTYVYNKAIQSLRKKKFKPTDKGVPLEYFEFERVIVDEIHESLCTTKGELKFAEETAKENDSTGFWKEKNRRAGRELLGITEKDISKRPLRFRKTMFGLTGTPLLDNPARVIELANLIGGTYIIGLSSHWRKLERESVRDIFLQHYLEPKQGREVRREIYASCQKYIDAACCRNKTGEEMGDVKLVVTRKAMTMTSEESELYLGSMSGIPTKDRSFSIQPADFDVSAGHDITKFLRQNAKMACRGRALVEICKDILSKDETTKIIVFADGAIGGGVAAREFLSAEEGLGCTWLDSTDSVQKKNEKIAWYQSGDVTEEDRARPRVLVLNFEHAAGLNLQTESNNLILFTPLYVGEGGTTGDAVADASTELQAIGRVYRPGQTKQQVNVYRIEVRGPGDEECLDGQLIRRNTDEETVAMATNAAD